jgi:hypothetical protein
MRLARRLQLGALRRALQRWRGVAGTRARLRRRLLAAHGSQSWAPAAAAAAASGWGGGAGAAAALAQRCGLARPQVPGLCRVLEEEGQGGVARAYRSRKLLLRVLWGWVAQLT